MSISPRAERRRRPARWRSGRDGVGRGQPDRAPVHDDRGRRGSTCGALVTLYLFGHEVNIYSFVRLVMLVGIVKKNAIMQIDFALDAERQHGKSPEEAIYEGCLIRFRPIMMTTMAALLGAVPIALGYGAGGEARRP